MYQPKQFCVIGKNLDGLQEFLLILEISFGQMNQHLVLVGNYGLCQGQNIPTRVIMYFRQGLVSGRQGLVSFKYCFFLQRSVKFRVVQTQFSRVQSGFSGVQTEFSADQTEFSVVKTWFCVVQTDFSGVLSVQCSLD